MMMSSSLPPLTSRRRPRIVLEVVRHPATYSILRVLAWLQLHVTMPNDDDDDEGRE